MGNFKCLIGWVEITDETGWADQSLKELLIKIAAIVKLTKTLMVHKTFPHLDSALLMWTSPWRLEASKNSFTGFMMETSERTEFLPLKCSPFITKSPIITHWCILIFDEQILETFFAFVIRTMNFIAHKLNEDDVSLIIMIIT